MPDVRFKDLQMDVTAGGDRPRQVAEFWGAALGQAVRLDGVGLFVLDPPAGGPSSRAVGIGEVPEAAAGKSRVHLDLRLPGGDPAPLVAMGGTVVRRPGDDVHWYVVNDPDGLPACVFGPHPQAPEFSGAFELVVDAADPAAIAEWWAQRTGGSVGRRDGVGFVWIEGAAGFPYLYWVFTPVPEPKTVKNRMHWDVILDEATIDDLVAAGATVLRAADDEIRWTVMADPEGNEFCVFR